MMGMFQLRYPRAAVFNAATPEEVTMNLTALVDMWAMLVEDIPAEDGEIACMRLMKTNKFMPTVDEFREEAEAEMKAGFDKLYRNADEISRHMALGLLKFDGDITEAYNALAEGERRAVDVATGLAGIAKYVNNGRYLKQRSFANEVYKVLLDEQRDARKRNRLTSKPFSFKLLNG